MNQTPTQHEEVRKLQLRRHIERCIMPWPNGLRCEAGNGIVQDCRDGYCRTYKLRLERVIG